MARCTFVTPCLHRSLFLIPLTLTVGCFEPATFTSNVKGAKTYSGRTFPFAPAFTLHNKNSHLFKGDRTVVIDGFSDSLCRIKLPSSVVSFPAKKRTLVDNKVVFQPPVVTLADGLERDIYFGIVANSEKHCFGPISVLHTLGTEGFVVFHPGAAGAAGGQGSRKTDIPYRVVIDSRGRSTVVGYSGNAAGGTAITLWRYLPNGSADTTFGLANGLVVLNASGSGLSGGEHDAGTSLAIDRQGRIVVSGTSRNSQGGQELVLLRFLENGTLDVAFGMGGLVRYGSSGMGAAGGTGPNHRDTGREIRIDTQGRYVVAGASQNALGGIEATVWRFHPDGSLDADFGEGGVAYFNNEGEGIAGAALQLRNDVITHLAVDSDGGYLLGGYSRNDLGRNEVVSLRYREDGSLDDSFGEEGVFIYQAGGFGAAGAAPNLKSDYSEPFLFSRDAAFLVGKSRSVSGVDELAVWKIDHRGSVYTTFGESGVAFPRLNEPGIAGASFLQKSDGACSDGAQLDSQGRLVIALRSRDAQQSTVLALTRLTSQGAMDTSFGNGLGYIVVPSTVSGGTQDYCYSLRIDSANRYVVTGHSADTTGGLDAVLWRFREDGSADK